MTDTFVMEVAAGALVTATKIGGPILLVTLVVGVLVSVIQTVTQVQEPTLTFVPKVLGVAVLLLLGGAWMIQELVAWVTGLWNSIPSMT